MSVGRSAAAISSKPLERLSYWHCEPRWLARIGEHSDGIGARLFDVLADSPPTLFSRERDMAEKVVI